MKNLFLIFLISFFSLSSIAENVTISGKVVDDKDKPVEFATVRVAGSAIGTNTDLQGMYSLTLSERDTIPMVFSCIGFKTVERNLINLTIRKQRMYQ